MNKFLITLSLIITLVASVVAQEKKEIKIRKQENKSDISLLIKEGAEADVYIDGKKYDSDIVELLDQDQIATVNVIGGDEALTKYNSSNKVILIISKKNIAKEKLSFEIDETNSEIKIRNKSNNELKPLLIVDGKEWDHDSLKKLDPNDIENIDVLKGGAAIKKYNAPNGVIIVKTKKGKGK